MPRSSKLGKSIGPCISDFKGAGPTERDRPKSMLKEFYPVVRARRQGFGGNGLHTRSGYAFTEQYLSFQVFLLGHSVYSEEFSNAFLFVDVDLTVEKV